MGVRGRPRAVEQNAAMTQADVTSASLPITLREPVRGSRWGSNTLVMSSLERLPAGIEGRLPDSPSMRLSGLRPSEVGAGVAVLLSHAPTTPPRFTIRVAHR
jgi:hypothetical protein